MMLQSQTEKLKRDAERVFPSHCAIALDTFIFHPLDHVVEYLEIFGGNSSTETRSLEQNDELLKQSCRMTSRRLSKQLQ